MGNPPELSKIIAGVVDCSILGAWHFDHVHAQPLRPAARAAARCPTAASGTAIAVSVAGPDSIRRRPTSSADGRRCSSANGRCERRELGNGPPGGERERDAGVVDAGEVVRFAGPAVGRGGSGGGVGVRGDGGGVTAAWDSGGGGGRVGACGRCGAGGRCDAVRRGGCRRDGGGWWCRCRCRGGPGAGAWQERAGLAVRERMPVWLQARCGLERRSVVALTVVLVAAAVLAGQHFWTGRVQPLRAPEVVRGGAPRVGAACRRGDRSPECRGSGRGADRGGRQRQGA